MRRRALRRAAMAAARLKPATPDRAAWPLRPAPAAGRRRGSMCRRRSASGSTVPAFSGHSASFSPGAAKISRKPASSPFARVAEAVEVEVRDRQAPCSVGFQHGVGGALDAALTPSARSRWRTKVVLPAPSGPCSSMKASAQRRLLRQRGRVGQAGGLVGPVTWRLPRMGACRESITSAGSRSCSGCGGGRVSWDSHRSASAGIDLARAEPGCRPGWTPAFTADMAYMAAHGLKRARPAALVPGTVCVISARMDYLPRSRRPTGWPARKRPRCTTRNAPWCRCMPGAGTITRCCASACSAGDRLAGRGGPAGPPRVHRFGAGAGSGTGHACRPGLAWQAHAGPGARRGFDVLPGRDLRRPGAAAG
jgi:hypothetical protein